MLEVDTGVPFRAIQLLNDKKKEETAIAAYWVTDGVDRCRVGFLPRFCIKHKSDFDGKLAQITELLSKSSNSSDRKKSHRNCGVATAVLIEVEVEVKVKVEVEVEVEVEVKVEVKVKVEVEEIIICSKRKFRRTIPVAEVTEQQGKKQVDEDTDEEDEDDNNNNRKRMANNDKRQKIATSADINIKQQAIFTTKQKATNSIILFRSEAAFNRVQPVAEVVQHSNVQVEEDINDEDNRKPEAIDTTTLKLADQI